MFVFVLRGGDDRVSYGRVCRGFRVSCMSGENMVLMDLFMCRGK